VKKQTLETTWHAGGDTRHGITTTVEALTRSYWSDKMSFEEDPLPAYVVCDEHWISTEDGSDGEVVDQIFHFEETWDAALDVAVSMHQAAVSGIDSMLAVGEAPSGVRWLSRTPTMNVM